MGMTVLRKGGSTPVASDDRILFDKIFDSAGIITGGGATMSAVNKIHVPETTAWIKGTEIKIDEQDVTVGLSDSGTKYGRVKLVVDWSTEETAYFEYEIAASTSAFPELVQEDNINFSAGIWEEVFATYTCTEASISDVAYCMSPLQDASGGSLIAGSESGTLSTQPYVTGQYIIWNGKLKKVTDPIAIGDTLAVGTNLSADTTVGKELYALNNSLTANGQTFYFDYQGGKFGYNESSARGAGTFHPFSSNIKLYIHARDTQNYYNDGAVEVKDLAGADFCNAVTSQSEYISLGYDAASNYIKTITAKKEIELVIATTYGSEFVTLSANQSTTLGVNASVYGWATFIIVE